MSVVTGKSALGPVSDAVMEVLNVDVFSGASGICPGGVWTDIPPDPVYPVTWFSVTEVPERTFAHYGHLVDLRVQVFSQHNAMHEAHTIMALAVDLLNAAVLTVEGFAFQFLTHLGTVRYPSFLVGGRSIKHVEARFEVLVLEAE